MKKTMKSIVIAAATSSMLLAGSAIAAEQKIAVVNMQEVMGQIPQSATIMQSLEAEFKDERAALTKLEKDIQYFQEKKQRDAALMSKKEIEELDKKIAEAYREYQTRGKAFQQQIAKRQNEETNKILALVRQAINNIAAKDKYDLVLEQKAVIFSKPDANISEKVIKQISKLN